MDIKIERDLIKSDLDKVNDIQVLEAIRRLLDFNKSKLKKLIPLTEDELFNRIVESRKAIGEGRLIANEEAKEYFRKKNGEGYN